MADSSPEPFSSIAVANNSLRIECIPDWIERLDVPWETRGLPDDHVVTLLSDTQWAPEKGLRFEREVRRLVSREAVQKLSQIEVQWDPQISNLIFHEVALYREGISRSFCERPRILLRQREESLESQILHGRMSAIVLLDDVRPNDCVEVVYTIETTKKHIGERFDLFFLSERWGVTGAWSVLVRLPGQTLCRWKTSDSTAPQSYQDQGDLVRVWKGSQSDSREMEVGVPGWHSVLGFGQVSGYESWREVASFLSDAWNTLDLGAAEIANFVEEHTRSLEGLEAKALWLIRWVQDDVRYLGIEMGLGGTLPSEPRDVLARRYGDCKDKSLLLCCLLRSIGIEADPVLVNTGLLHVVETLLPAAGAFNHAIMTCVINGSRLFVDATQSGQGGDLFHRSLPAYGKGLVLNERTEDLVDVVCQRTEVSALLYTEDFYLSSGRDFSYVEWRLEAVGGDADLIRNRVQQIGLDQFAKGEAEGLRTFLPDVQSTGPCLIQDDREANRIVLRGKCVFGNFGQPQTDGKRALYYQPRWVCMFLTYPPSGKSRKNPLELRKPSLIRHEVRFHSTKHFLQKRICLRSESEWFKAFTHVERTSARDVLFAFSYQALREVVTPNEFEAYEKAFRNFHETQMGCNLVVGWNGPAKPVLSSDAVVQAGPLDAVDSLGPQLDLAVKNNAVRWLNKPPEQPWSFLRVWLELKNLPSRILGFFRHLGAFRSGFLGLILFSALLRTCENEVNTSARTSFQPANPPQPLPRRPDPLPLSPEEANRLLNGSPLKKGSDSQFAIAWQNALAKFDSRDYPLAEQYVKEVLTKRPGDPDATKLLMSILERTNRRTEAAELGEKFLEKYPSDLKAHSLLISNYIAQKSYARALELAEHVASLQPKNIHQKIVMGEILRLQGRNTEAVNLIQELYKNSPLDPEVLYSLGVLLINSGDPSAVDYHQKLTELRPSARNLAIFGRTLHRVGRIEEARETLEKATEKDAQDPMAWTYLEQVYKDLGMAKERLDALQRLNALPKVQQ